jgi:hypothetical protein
MTNRLSPRLRATWRVSLLVAGACSDNTALPPPAPDCNGRPDAACSVPPTGGGETTPPNGTNDSGSMVVIVVQNDGAATCGEAETVLTSAAATCVPCIESGTGSSTRTSCCSASMACSADATCLSILQCAAACPVGNVGCIDGCETTRNLATPTGATNFVDFAQCLQQNCSPQCPTLTPGTTDL